MISFSNGLYHGRLKLVRSMARPDVLICSSPAESEVQLVLNLLRLHGRRPLLIDQTQFPHPCRVYLSIGTQADEVTIQTGNQAWDLGEISSAWLHRSSGLSLATSKINGTARRLYREEWQASFRGLWSLLRSARWLNKPETQEEVESNKLAQLAGARDCGLTIPDTLVTSAPDLAMRFSSREPAIIAKLLGAPPLGLRNPRTRKISTHDISQVDLLAPIFLQREIRKRFDIRVAYVNGQTYAVELHSQLAEARAVDWRQPTGGPLLARRHELDTSVVHALTRFMQTISLRFGVIDLVLTPDGEYVFLEVNPQGHWDIHANLGLPVADAIATYLAYQGE